MDENNNKEGIKVRITWIFDILNRFDFNNYTEEQVIELKQAISAYNSLLNNYPKELLEVLREVGVDYTDFSLGRLREAQVFINNYNMNLNTSTKTAKI